MSKLKLNINILLITSMILSSFGFILSANAFVHTTPLVVTSINAPMTITYSQRGNLTNNFGQQTSINVKQTSINVNIPKGAVLNKTTFVAQISTITDDQIPANTNEAFMIGNNVFNVSATDSNNDAVTSFNENLTITITLPSLPSDALGIDAYSFNNLTSQWVLIPGTVIDPMADTIVFNINHLTLFAIIRGNGLDMIKLSGEKAITPVEQVGVLGVEYYGEGALLRGSNMKIYVVSNGALEYIASLEELAKYAGQEIIDVDDEDIAAYGQSAVEEVEVLGVEYYANVILLRGSNMKVYVVSNGALEYIASLEELAKYAGQEIIDVDDYVINNF